MKHLKYISLFIAIVVAVWSCKNDDNMDALGDWTLTAPTTITPIVDASIILNENTPNEALTFEWTAAESSAEYQIRYSIEIFDNDTTIASFQSDNVGKGLTANITYAELDEKLSMLGYAANSTAALQWRVVANCVGTLATDGSTINVKRFATEWIPGQLYLSGSATENGDDISTAIPMKKLLSDANIFEVYTHLETGATFSFFSQQELPAHIYGGSNGTLVKSGTALLVEESGEYRITVNLDDNTYSLSKINYWGAVGGAFSQGWNGDEILEYQGGGIWQAEVNFVNTDGYIFRTDGSWDNILKQIDGTDNQLVLESFGNTHNIPYKDLSATNTGMATITIDLSANGYTFDVQMTDSGGDPVPTPDALFLLDASGNTIGDFTKDGDVLISNGYFALQAGETYLLNSAQDGSGTSYQLNENLGVSDAPAGDKVRVTTILKKGEEAIGVDLDQAYSISIDFSIGELSWQYYNLKVFHWDDAGDGWDDRTETPMSYSHPFTFSVDVTFSAGLDTKFNSPWDVEFGAKQGTDDKTALSGTSTNKALQEDADTYPNENFKFAAGNYSATLIINSDYKTASYTLE